MSVALKLGRIDPNELLKPPAGYGMVDAPPELVQEMRTEIAASDPEFDRYITGVAIKSVVSDQQPVAIAGAVSMDPAFSALPGLRESFFEGFEEFATSKQRITIGGTDVRRVDGDGVVGFAWQRYSACAWVVGEEPDVVESIARAFILGTETSSA